MSSVLLCEHVTERTRRQRIECTTCGSFADRDFAPSAFAYTDTYAQERAHYDSWVGRCKVRTLAYWLKRLRLDVTGGAVCEVGFGGGHCLELLAKRGAQVFGIEAVPAALLAAKGRGIPSAQLFKADALPAKLGAPIELWIFQDSFEHLPAPSAFVEWMIANSARQSRVLIVCPRADSISSSLMGGLWPHRLPDHPFHWSLSGLQGFFERRGYQLQAKFFPLKFVSAQTFVLHVFSKFGPGVRLKAPNIPVSVPFNIGEMGLLFLR